MSKGPGHIEAKLVQLFSNQPRAILTTAEICRRVYATPQVDKKHRVAVLRALKRLGRRSMPTLWRMVQKYERSDDLWLTTAASRSARMIVLQRRAIGRANERA